MLKVTSSPPRLTWLGHPCNCTHPSGAGFIPNLPSGAFARAIVILAAVCLGAFLFLVFLVHLTPRQVSSPLVSGSRSSQIRVGDRTLSVEVADTDESRARGLMNRPSLPWDEGMLFIFESEQPLSFWMKNTPIPLDIAFADASGVIFQIEQMEPQTLNPHLSVKPAKYALEVNRGWFEAHGVKIGDKLSKDNPLQGLSF